MKKILLLALAFAFASCDKNAVYSEMGRDFKDNRWMSGDVQNFDFGLDSDIAKGSILFTFSHVHDPQFTTIPVAAVITYPSGEKENIALLLELKDAECNSVSECLGDVCDLHTTLKKGTKLAKGKYSIALKNNFPNSYLPNAIAVGISVETDN